MKRPIESSLILDKFLNYPHKNYPIIHITGTNGKGSVSSMIASILIESGYKVGTFNTPGIFSEMDIVKINGISISIDEHKKISLMFDKIINENNIKTMFKSTRRAELAFKYFSDNNIDIAVIETDLGAANDSTAVVNPIVSLLTNITEDHLNLFNNDIIKYATEKAGIIKNNIPIYISETPTNEIIKNILLDKAKECNSFLTFTDSEDKNLIIEYKGDGVYNTKFGEISISLGGDYQKDNLNLVLNAILELQKQGYKITNENIINGLEKIYENTKFCGRWQYLSKNPNIILDCCHNVDAWKKVLKQISNMNYNELHFIIHTCKDKDVDKITKMLIDDKNITYWFPKPYFNRLMDSNSLLDKTKWMNYSKRYGNFSMEEILNKLYNNINENDIIFIGGTCKVIKLSIDIVQKLKG